MCTKTVETSEAPFKAFNPVCSSYFIYRIKTLILLHNSTASNFKIEFAFSNH